MDLLSGIGAPKAVIDGTQGVLDFLAGSALSLFIEATDGGLLAIDGLITLDAGIWAAIGPVADRDKWKELAYGYLANALGDLVTLPIIAAGFTSANFFPSGILAQGVDSTVALARVAVLARKALVSALQSFWNVRGGNVLPHVPGTGPGPEEGLDPIDPQAQAGSLARMPQDSVDPLWADVLAAAQGCFDRGDGVMGEAAAGWEELWPTPARWPTARPRHPRRSTRCAPNCPRSPPRCRRGWGRSKGRGPARRRPRDDRRRERPDRRAARRRGGPHDPARRGARAGAQHARARGRRARRGQGGDARAAARAADDAGRVAAAAEVVAGAARETLGLLEEGIGRVADAAAHCDDVADFVHDVATLSVGGEDTGSIDSALADWQTLAPQIADARAAF